jgi:hypothetical protein
LEDGIGLEAVCPFSSFVFESAVGPRTVALLPTATVQDARIALAAQLGVSPEAVLLSSHGNPIPDSDLISAHPHPSLSCLQEMLFIFDSQRLSISVDFDAPIGRVKESVSARISIPATAFSLHFHGSELDDDMTIKDIITSEKDYLTIHQTIDLKAAPSGGLRELRVVFLVGIIPRNTLIKIEASKTLRDLLPLVLAKFNAQDLALEFVSGDPDEDNWSFLPLSTSIADVPDNDAAEYLALRESSAMPPQCDTLLTSTLCAGCCRSRTGRWRT